MRVTHLAYLLAAVSMAPAVYAQTAPAAAPTATAPAAPERYSVEDTDVGTLLDDPAAKAVLVKYLPELVASPQIDMARSLTLKAMQQYAPDKLSDDTLGKIEIDLMKVPVKKS